MIIDVTVKLTREKVLKMTAVLDAEMKDMLANVPVETLKDDVLDNFDSSFHGLWEKVQALLYGDNVCTVVNVNEAVSTKDMLYDTAKKVVEMNTLVAGISFQIKDGG